VALAPQVLPMRPAPSTALNTAPPHAQPLQQVPAGEAKAKAAALSAQQRAQRVPNYALLAKGEER
jgi:hypothetical protein